MRLPIYERNVAPVTPETSTGFNARANNDAANSLLSASNNMQEAITKTAFNIYNQYTEAEKSKEKLLRLADVSALKNEYVRAKDELAYGENGYFNTKGRNALDSFEAFNASLIKLREKYTKRLTGEYANIFAESVDPIMLDTQRQAAVHKNKNFEEYILQEHVASALSNGNQFIKTANDDERSSGYLNAAILELTTKAHLEGKSPEETANEINQFIGSLVKSSVPYWVDKDHNVVNKLLDKYADNIDAENYGEIKKSIKPFNDKSVVEAAIQASRLDILPEIPWAPSAAGELTDPSNPVTDPAAAADVTAAVYADLKRKGQKVSPASTLPSLPTGEPTNIMPALPSGEPQGAADALPPKGPIVRDKAREKGAPREEITSPLMLPVENQLKVMIADMPQEISAAARFAPVKNSSFAVNVTGIGGDAREIDPSVQQWLNANAAKYGFNFDNGTLQHYADGPSVPLNPKIPVGLTPDQEELYLAALRQRGADAENRVSAARLITNNLTKDFINGKFKKPTEVTEDYISTLGLDKVVDIFNNVQKITTKDDASPIYYNLFRLSSIAPEKFKTLDLLKSGVVGDDLKKLINIQADLLKEEKQPKDAAKTNLNALTKRAVEILDDRLKTIPSLNAARTGKSYDEDKYKMAEKYKYDILNKVVSAVSRISENGNKDISTKQLYEMISSATTPLNVITPGILWDSETPAISGNAPAGSIVTINIEDIPSEEVERIKNDYYNRYKTYPDDTTVASEYAQKLGFIYNR